jgi:hypothetical protein
VPSSRLRKDLPGTITWFWINLAGTACGLSSFSRDQHEPGGAGGQDLYGNVAFQLLIVSQKHHAHPTRADVFPDTVVAEILPEHIPKPNAMLRGKEIRVKCR